MTFDEFLDQPLPEQIIKFDKYFTLIFDENGNEVNSMPDEKLTVYCDGGSFETRGYCINVSPDELGLEALIAKKWILHAELLQHLKTV